MEQQELSNNCCGCGMCAFICPQNAIKMEQDVEGFFRPAIDSKLCINCGKCIHNCAYKSFAPASKVGSFYAAKNKDASIIEKSSSGGIFNPLASIVIKNAGVVYGVSYNWEECTAEHVRIDSISQIQKCMGSKYVQSTHIDYSAVKHDLSEGRIVLFTGCPCQVDACIRYLKINKVDTRNLVTVDIVCHGVPSPSIWKDFVSTLENKHHARLTDFSFRYKSDNCKWGTVNTCALFGDTKVTNSLLTNSYIKLYFERLMMRDDCTRCPYTKLNRVSDITLADCWGIEDVFPEFNSSNGVSLVIINTEKGQDYKKQLCEQVEFVDIDYTKLNQPHLYKPSTHSPNRNEFWRLYRSGGYFRAAHKYGMNTIGKRIKHDLSEIKQAVLNRIR